MIPDFGRDGRLPAGVHQATWSEFAARFATTPHRRELLSGLEAGLRGLRVAGCAAVYVDGSFTTNMETIYNEAPRDFDACWDESGVDINALDAVFLDFSAGRAAQKARFGGEFFPAHALADFQSWYIDYFQRDKITGRAKGIVKIVLETLP